MPRSLTDESNDVVTIKPTATLGDAVRILDMHRIGAVVITGADQQMLGILSALRAHLSTTPELHGCQFYDEPVERVMTRQDTNVQTTPKCLLMALSGHPHRGQQCPLLGVKRTSLDMQAKRGHQISAEIDL